MKQKKYKRSTKYTLSFSFPLCPEITFVYNIRITESETQKVLDAS